MPSTVLARRVGVANNTIWRIEAGRRTPSLELLEKVARHLRTEPAELLREPAPAGKGDASREAGPEEREEADLRTWRHLLSSVLDSTAESGGEIPTAVQALVARRLLEELSRTIGTAPEAREVQERLRALRHQLAALVHQGSHTPLSSEQESALREAHKLLAALLEPSLAGPEEERRSAEADR